MADPQSLRRSRSLLAPVHRHRRQRRRPHQLRASPNHAFYLAIEGGTNRTSGLSVQGVGAGNREQIERVFYRAFTQMLPANATFASRARRRSSRRAIMFGANSAAERASHAGLDGGRCQLKRSSNDAQNELTLSSSCRSCVALRVVLAASPAAAQTWSERVLVSVNGGIQATTHDVSDRFEFEANLETGTTEVDYPFRAGSVRRRPRLSGLEEPCGAACRSRTSRETTRPRRRRAFRIRSSSISRASVSGRRDRHQRIGNRQSTCRPSTSSTPEDRCAWSFSGGPSFFTSSRIS